nr:MAG TPA: hypothetical protein [Caudoviricetes sp.]
MLIRKIAVVGSTKTFDYVKENDAGGKSVYSMTAREDGRESFYNAWKALVSIVNSHMRSERGDYIFLGVTLIIKRLEIKYMEAVVGGKITQVPSDVRFSGTAMTKDGSFKYVTDWIELEEKELILVNKMLNETKSYIQGRRAQEQLFESE